MHPQMDFRTSAAAIYSKDMEIKTFAVGSKMHRCTMIHRCKRLQQHPKLNEMFEHSIRPSGALPISNTFVSAGRKHRGKKKQNIRLWKENKACTSLNQFNHEHEEVKCSASSSEILHVSADCEFAKLYTQKWQEQNSWEVLLDNKLSLKDLIAAHLEPLTHSSSTILHT